MKQLNSNLLAIVKRLNDGQYHDGTSIGQQLQITRSAVWKIIKKLEAYGISLNSVKGKGYVLTDPLILLEAVQIQRQLLNKEVEIDIFETIDSTIEYLKKIEAREKIIFCLAEQQTQGRGRFNRYWHSPFAQNIYLSFLYPFQQDISELTGLGFVVSLAVLKTLKNYIGSEFLIKWPNDIMYDEKKLAGCLIEVQAETHGQCRTIISVGINVNSLLDETRKISQPWTSLRKITQNYIDRNQLAAGLIDNLLQYIRGFETQGLATYLDDWRKVDYLATKQVSLKAFDKSFTGLAKGIDSQGHLLLELTDGTVQVFASGDTSVSNSH